MPLGSEDAKESIAAATASMAASGVLFATIGFRPWRSMWPLRSTNPTATFVPPISTPRIGVLFFASVMFRRRCALGHPGKLHFDGLDLVRFCVHAHCAVFHGQGAEWFFHQVSFSRSLRSCRKLHRDLTLFSRPLVKTQNQRILVFGLFQRRDDHIVRLRLQKRMLSRQRSPMPFERQ